ncbi:isopentenyl-diphosphate Delta-isomerase [soil metagenome]
MQEVILVDENDQEIGTEEKLKAHQIGKLHRAFSIFVLNAHNELLIQKRAAIKYHSGNLWTNTCCSHPSPGDNIEDAIHIRLQEEMGFDCELKFLFKFIYKTEFNNGLTEHELDYVYLGRYNADPVPDQAEVGDWKWINLGDLKEDIQKNPEKYTFWFNHIFNQIYDRIKDDL